jgi:hypothetical protein
VAWTSKKKTIELKSVTAHRPRAKPGIRGRAPSVSEIRFTPDELFGAMARCSHLHPVDASAVTFESEGCRHLLSQHVDDQADHFAILPTAKRLKDFSRTHMVGVVGAGIAYLQMIRDGYVWCDHFENLTLAGPPPTKRTPDFVFNRPGDTDVAVTESKATHGSSRKQFSNTVESGYLTQVDPYLGLELSGAIASHGFSIGSWMTSPTRGELLINHTAQPVSSPSMGAPGTPKAIRRGNYLTVLSLMFGPAVADGARAGAWPSSETDFLIAHWLDREWLLGFPPQFRGSVPIGLDIDPALTWLPWLERSVFALELNISRVVLRSLTRPDGAEDFLAGLPRMDEALIGRAREDGGAVYPDGFAVLGTRKTPQKIKLSLWRPQSGEIGERIATEPAESLAIQTFQIAKSIQPTSWMHEEDGEKKHAQLLRLTLREPD